MSKPVAVLISDIHFTPSTLELASEALVQAQAKALQLRVPLVIAGDTLDSKAIIRGECANRLISLLANSDVYTYILVGNHDKLNEKSNAHSLNFLNPYCDVVSAPVYSHKVGSWLIPYQNSPEDLAAILKDIPAGSRIICHQGVQGAWMGHYVQDKTSLPKEAFADYRVISGHYHRRQDIKCGRPRKGAVGLFSYIGNPYSLSFSEADDGDKGFQILHDDGILEFVPTALRCHRVFSRTTQEIQDMVERGDPWLGQDLNNDLIWLKVTGPSTELAKLKKSDLGKALFGHSNFKLDKIASDTARDGGNVADKTPADLLDSLIDGTNENLVKKTYLKALWREVLRETT